MDEALRIIEEYIYQRKGVRVTINMPDTPERWQLFWAAYFVAKTWTGTSPSEDGAGG
jgi:hypothetical protein